jgi:hypothetical protein
MRGFGGFLFVLVGLGIAVGGFVFFRFAVGVLLGLAVFVFLGFAFLFGLLYGALEMLHDDGDAAIGRVAGVVAFPETLVGEAADLGDLIATDAVGLHDAAGRVGTVRT